MRLKHADLILAAAGEGSLVFFAAAVGWAVHQPLVFASLGPTAYELVEKPNARSARPYNIIAGHLCGVSAGFLALAALNAWSAPKVLSTGIVTPSRIWAAALAAGLTALLALLFHASQPASTSTTLLVALGAMQTPRGALAIIGGVLLVMAMGEPLRRYRLRLARDGTVPLKRDRNTN
jgi:HPP family